MLTYIICLINVYSVGNFDQSEIGSPVLDVILQAGDLLYFPRGTIHQVCLINLYSDISINETFLIFLTN